MDFPQPTEKKKRPGRKPSTVAKAQAQNLVAKANGEPPPNDPPPVKMTKKLKEKTLAQVMLDDLKQVYFELGGKEFVINHVRSSPNYKQKMIESLTKLAAKQIESDMRVSVSGTVDHVHRFGFTPETIITMMQKLQTDGNLNWKQLEALPVPQDVTEDQPAQKPIDAEFKVK